MHFGSGVSTMFIKFLGIIVPYTTFLGICADTILEHHRYEEILNQVDKVLVKKSNDIEELKSLVQTQKNEMTKLKMTLFQVERLQGIHDKSTKTHNKVKDQLKIDTRREYFVEKGQPRQELGTNFRNNIK